MSGDSKRAAEQEYERKRQQAERKARADALVHGRWPDILMAAGMSDQFFRRSNGPCPFCGGADRYQWSDKHGGVWVCRKCTDGHYQDGYAMLVKHKGYTYFWQAIDYLLGENDLDTPISRLPVRREVPAVDVEKNLSRMTALWKATREVREGDPVHQYLHRRVPGLSFAPEMIRFHPALEYWAPPPEGADRPVLLGKFPAMVAQAFDAKGRFVQLHKTYLTEDGQKASVPNVKKTDRGIGVNGFAVPMMQVNGDTLGVAEGIESALGGAMLRGIPVWPCLNGPSMAAFDVPEHLLQQVERFVIFTDHDALKALPPSSKGQRFRSAGSHYAEQLAERIRARGKRVLVVKPSRVGFDMADQWAELYAREAATA
jgi:putative DNA primase/helicase